MATALGRELVVAWAASAHCAASFGDLFDAQKLPPGTIVVEVIKRKQRVIKRKRGPVFTFL